MLDPELEPEPFEAEPAAAEEEEDEEADEEEGPLKMFEGSSEKRLSTTEYEDQNETGGRVFSAPIGRALAPPPPLTEETVTMGTPLPLPLPITFPFPFTLLVLLVVVVLLVPLGTSKSL